MFFLTSDLKRVILVGNSVINNNVRKSIYKCFGRRPSKEFPRNIRIYSTLPKEGQYKSVRPDLASRNKSAAIYLTAFGVIVVGVAFAAVPLYSLFCSTYGVGGTVKHGLGEVLSSMSPLEDRIFEIEFQADANCAKIWKFKPETERIQVKAGETALAFYTAKNPTDKTVIGVSTYNVLPFKAGPYFNKIQCFCFEEQMLNPGEEVSLPVFFYIDPEIDDDPALEFVNKITLCYTFFEAKPNIPMPGFIKKAVL